MRKVICLALAAAGSCWFPSAVTATECAPGGVLLGQLGVNSFATNFPGCTVISGDLFIGETEEVIDKIDNLDPFAAITRVEGDLTIFGTQELNSLDGLMSLSFVGGRLDLLNHSSLTQVDGLSSLVDAGGGVYIDSAPLLENVDGLSGLTDLTGELYIGRTDSLKDLSGLANLTSAGGLAILQNSALLSLSGLENLISINGVFVLAENPALEDCDDVTALLDRTDDGEPGPGPGEAGLPDVAGAIRVDSNGGGCNPVETLPEARASTPIPTMSTYGLIALFTITLLTGAVATHRRS